MKAAGSYNPVTQSAGGSYEYDRTDYRESRTNWLIGLAIFAGIIIAGYYVLKSLSANLNPFTAAGNAAGAAANAAGAAVAAANQASIDTVVRAAGKQPGEAATAEYWDAAKRYLGEGAISTTAISAGNVILSTPIINNLGQPLLAQATIAGQGFRQDLDSYGDYDRLEADPLKGLIVTGEGLSRTLAGFSPYEAGKATSAWLAGIGK